MATKAKTAEKKVPGLTSGRMVHYVIPNGKLTGQHQPGVVVDVHDYMTGEVDLLVFMNTDVHNLPQVPHVIYSTGGELGTWHYIEKA